jgi:mono/diheme cytochrome c family protein
MPPKARLRLAMIRLLLRGLLCSLLLGPVSALAQVDDPELVGEFKSGLVGVYEDAGRHAARRIDYQISLDWNGSSPDRRLTDGPYKVTWNGYLMSQGLGMYRFAVEVAGELTIKLGEQIVLQADSDESKWFASKPLELPFDYHPFAITFVGDRNARLALFWSGPQFAFEPIGHRQLYHDLSHAPKDHFATGAQLVRKLQCGACHPISGEPENRRAPSLEHLTGQIHRDWLVTFVHQHGAAESHRQAHFAFDRAEAEAIADYLLEQSRPVARPAQQEASAQSGRASQSKQKDKKKVDPVTAGEHLFLTTGCLACHQIQDLGKPQLFGGGDLTRIAEKRPVPFFEHWLADPASLNQDHHMPLFSLTTEERGQLTSFLATRGNSHNESRASTDQTRISHGRQLVAEANCVACHRLADDSITVVDGTTLSSTTDWNKGCLTSALVSRRQPGFRLAKTDRSAIREFVSALPVSSAPDSSTLGPSTSSSSALGQIDGKQFLLENNCLACHARGRSLGLADQLTHLASRRDHLAPLVPAMTPPSLDQVGDKLHRRAIESALQRDKPAHRDYLQVRMPRFPLADTELQSLVDHLITADRLPDAAAESPSATAVQDEVALKIVGSRLVTSAGFGCTSCHQVGDVHPSKAPLNARGPDISLVGSRIRRSWFDRFVSNPARIVPRMEMPAVKVAVRGVLDDALHRQLAAVWEVLNQPGFQPPEPDPVRVVRQSGLDAVSRALVVTDVVRTKKRTYLKPLLVGLSNRHNLLFDLESAAVAYWSIGDTARQRTEGKSWYWEAGGTVVLDAGLETPELVLLEGRRETAPSSPGQFPTECDSLVHRNGEVQFRHRLRFDLGSERRVVLHVHQSLAPRNAGSQSGFDREVKITGIPADTAVRLRIADSEPTATAVLNDDERTWHFPSGARITLLRPRRAAFDSDGSITAGPVDQQVTFRLRYTTSLPVDRFPASTILPDAREPVELQVVPGFAAVRLPITDELMPTGLAWRPNGQLVIASLKGRVWLAEDTNGDRLEDRLWPFSDDLAAPYGVAANEDSIDVINKYALLRLYDENGDGQVDRTETVASGWGHTTDYHDWAVGLPREPDGSYLVAIPCQQDQRTEAAARLRGTIIRLKPTEPTADDPHRFTIKTVTGGHRFPMGLARRSDGELFVTDNQGHYNPFNELNHVVAGARYGFINLLERKPGFLPPLTPPAIDIPHPWTRSVNGICFLETPPQVRANGGSRFGPFEGHLIGCEYDTRRLIRMTLQKVGGTFQGAAYPFSYEEPSDGPPFLGPLTCAISPSGDLYVGGIRDSGWGGANNVGELARLQPQFDRLPCGIAEVRAGPDGLSIRFTKPVERSLAGKIESYDITTYTRVSTPAYGGPDHDRSSARIRSVRLSDNEREVAVTLDEMKEGYVYEINVKPLAREKCAFFPSVAHYTMRRVPVE